jgi:hypothetical protein
MAAGISVTALAHSSFAGWANNDPCIAISAKTSVNNFFINMFF